MRDSPPRFEEALVELLGRLDEFDEGVDLADYVVVEHYPIRADYGSKPVGKPVGAGEIFALQFLARGIPRDEVNAEEPVPGLLNIATYIPDVSGSGRPLVQLQGKSGRPYEVADKAVQGIVSELDDVLTARYGHLPDFELLIASAIPAHQTTSATAPPLIRLLRERGVRYTVSLLETSLRAHQEKPIETPPQHDHPV